MKHKIDVRDTFIRLFTAENKFLAAFDCVKIKYRPQKPLF